MSRFNEIGSDFWNTEKTNTEFFLSGRTAEEYIIRDILETRIIKSALLPSLCCYTMIEPFLRNNIPVNFYDVISDDGLRAVLPEKRDNEILLYLDYFGYGRVKGLETVKDWDVTIEDCTHSWIRKNGTDADYSFISFRKWTGFTAIARADKKNERFVIKQDNEQSIRYEKNRKKAMELKRDFLEYGVGVKESYLTQFQCAEELLASDYIGYRPAYESLVQLLSLNENAIRKKRRWNSRVLYEGLKDIKQIKFLIAELSDLDVPLNVPVLIENGLRNKLRRYLIDHDIYCPIHWPLSELHTISMNAKEIYDKEISLVCDQRYNTSDMKREVRLIKSFFRC